MLEVLKGISFSALFLPVIRCNFFSILKPFSRVFKRVFHSGLKFSLRALQESLILKGLTNDDVSCKNKQRMMSQV